MRLKQQNSSVTLILNNAIILPFLSSLIIDITFIRQCLLHKNIKDIISFICCFFLFYSQNVLEQINLYDEEIIPENVWKANKINNRYIVESFMYSTSIIIEMFGLLFLSDYILSFVFIYSHLTRSIYLQTSTLLIIHGV